MLLYTINTNYNYKFLAKIKKPKISWDKFKELPLKEDFKIVLKKKKRE